MAQKTIIFDCDGVLVDSEIIYSAIERKYLEHIGLTYTDSEYQERFAGLTNEDYIRELSSDYRAKYSKVFPAGYESVVANECSISFESDLKAIEGAADFIGTLEAPSAVASSSNLEILNRKLELTGLNRFFGSNVYSGEQVQRGKPSPDIFLYAAKKLGVFPEQCLVIEDSINGVVAGLNANMEVWGFVGGGHIQSDTSARLLASGATKVFSSFSSLKNYRHNT